VERSFWNDQKIEGFIGNLLRAGVMLSALVVVIGGAVYLARHGFARTNYRSFHSEPVQLRTLTGIVRFAVRGHGQGIIQLGLLLLIATPVARVAFSVWGFAIERDRMYVLFTLIVLAVLLYSLFGSSALGG